MIVATTKPQSAIDIEQSITPFIMALAYIALVFTMLTPVLSWITVLAVCVVIVRGSFYFRDQQPQIALRTVNLLAILAAITLGWFSLSLGLLLTMVNLLVMACAFKLLRITRRKDLTQLFASLLFLTGCGFIFEQGLLHTSIYVSITLVLLCSLITIHAPHMSKRGAIKYTGIQLLQAMPIAVLLFLVLPKLPPLWQMPTAQGAKTGLSDTVTPGDIAELSQSSELAFRAIFSTELPRNNQRYWRAMTLEQFDGKTWTRSPTRRQITRQYRQLGRSFTPVYEGEFWDYQVIAEPSHQTWLFALDVASPSANSEFGVNLGFEYQVYASRPVVSTMSYTVESYYNMSLDQTLQTVDSRVNLQIPSNGNPKTVEWVAGLVAQTDGPSDFIDAIQRYFLEQEFSYTLRPQPMPKNPVDEFLFNQQAGFCVHYASALAYALRLANIPARLVTGYQGGEIQSDAVISVYQYDAHAWVEAWLDDRGWVRIDPTAWVSPDRIDFGLEQAMREEGSFLADSPLSLARLKNIAAFNQLRLWFANLDYQWSKWVLGFNNQQQKDILRQIFGELTTAKLSVIGLSLVALIALLLGLYILPMMRNRSLNPLANEYRKSVELVEASFAIKRATLGPEDFLQRVADSADNASTAVFAQITEAYIKSEYQPSPAQFEGIKQLQQLRRLLRKTLKKNR
ncbi:DUF3488 and transglutaminase-like domain-containing protein [Alteromonas sp. ASW11-36]|uniref:DUF3488 and transglutaminase-like domain-containing protein n=1 Tax=Alteromonas arenosi TaxID=3055817 RepID=A0ABT7T059_9ALTE|nr:DUF3488 and transglutaminase-like domain-containing protein [Alteromonas sp. ASW11-36]MDM7861179.1 DUF3488 and transglutaminase-like domain-containing protein [Alteromonas sp. ASW11-36]